MDIISRADLVIGAVALFFTLLGAKRGLFKSLAGLLVVIAAFAGALILASYAAEPLGNLLYPAAEERFIAMLPLPEKTDLAGSELLLAVDAVQQKLAEYGVELPVEELLLNIDSTTIISAAAKMLFLSVLQGILSIVFFLLLLIVLKLLVNTFNLVFKLPLLHFANTMGGAAFGLIEGLLFIFLGVFLLQKCGGSLSQHAQGSFLLPLFLSNSPITLLSALLQRGI